MSTPSPAPAGSRHWPSLAAVCPLIAHYDNVLNRLRGTSCGQADCTSGNQTSTLDDPLNEDGRFATIAIGVDGLPVIAYRDETFKAVKVLKCGTRSCQ